MPQHRRLRWRALWPGVDPGLVRLETATVAVAAVLLAIVVIEAVRAALAPQLPVTIVLFGAVLAMFANIAVKDATLGARRLTTALMAVPAAVAAAAGTLLAPHRVVADAVFVLVVVFAVWVRRFGPRADALGMATFVPFYSTQFFGAKPEQVPWLVVAAVLGLGATLLVRGFLLPGRPRRTLRRVARAYASRAHALVLAVEDVLTAAAGREEQARTRSLRALRRRRDRLHTTALQVENELDKLPPDDRGKAAPAVVLQTYDSELALEGLAVAVRHLVLPAAGPRRFAERPDGPGLPAVRRALGHLLAATDPNSRPADAQLAARAAADLVAGTRSDEGAGSLGEVTRAVAGVAHVLSAPPPAIGTVVDVHDPADPAAQPASGPAAPPRTLRITTRSALQVGVGVAAAIAVAEVVAPQRWYWSVLTVFVLYNGTQSRGEVLTRGWLRLLGTFGGVLVGAALTSLTGGNSPASLTVVFCCLFLALYLAPVSPALLAFFITIVLALLYGLLGRFGFALLGLRLEETLIGAVCGALAAFVILPRRTGEALAESVDAVVAAMDAVLAALTERTDGPAGTATAHQRTRTMHTALATARQQVEIHDGPLPRPRSRARLLLRTLTVMDHYLRALTRLATRMAPAELACLGPAIGRVRADVAALARPAGGSGEPGGQESGSSDARAAGPRLDDLVGDLADQHESDDLGTAADLLERIDRAAAMAAADGRDARAEMTVTAG